ncbi:hypothetical protein CBR_g49051 [Chara braunii]|uniref:Uncharacterized protein n=1 Tax=Chara braunii TaxID=69332 RepID=A0A388M474_CHABU|nr:hypothetical protein CBR_g49051 [Chara braunii]|eukprot:GBG89341.1 hypothetical protein CBR_g49051 [Chara braunii]
MGEDCELSTKFRHDGASSTEDYSVDIHPVASKPFLLVAGDEGTLQVWDYETGELVASCSIPRKRVARAKFVPQEHWAILTDQDSIHVYEQRGDRLVEIKTICANNAGGTVTWKFAVHPLLPMMLTAAGTDVKLWSWSPKWDHICLKNCHTDLVTDVAAHPLEAGTFASCSVDMTIKVWSQETNLKTLRCRNKVMSVQFGWKAWQKPLLFASAHPPLGSSVGELLIWDYKKGNCIATFGSHPGTPRAFFPHPAMPYLVSADNQSNIKVWNETSCKMVSSFSVRYLRDLHCLVPCRHSNFIAAGGRGTAAVIEVERTGKGGGSDSDDDDDDVASAAAKAVVAAALLRMLSLSN